MMLHRDVQDPMKDLVEPAVHGTQNVLSSVAKSKDTVKKVIQTSSFAGMPSVLSFMSLLQPHYTARLQSTP